MPCLCSSLLLSLLIASSASAVDMQWTLVGTPNHQCDRQADGCFGKVVYAYLIGTYEVTNEQYAEFLNAKAASDPYGLYSMSMASGAFIFRSGSVGSFSYATGFGRAETPVIFVSAYDAMRFANWLHNGKGNGDTETGAYTLLGGTPTPSNGTTVTRNADATIFLANEDEWYKAAYYDPASKSFFLYPAGSDTETTCAQPTATPNRANCVSSVGDVTAKGSYPGSPSPYGTFDQGGNVWEWNETIIDGSERGVRGGSWNGGFSYFLRADSRNSSPPTLESNDLGFRVAPEPAGQLLLISGAVTVFALASLARRAKVRS